MARIPAKRLELLSIQAMCAHRQLVRSVNSSLAPGGWVLRAMYPALQVIPVHGHT